ncbi:glycosyltransferase family 4 protein [Cohnella cholangitidis]|uniref:glycosyltransferase family 4 protein n=1 Tax=Cohnella cholangitidis TaxID=2598458 RepID=UPI001E4F6770|nr:glycosyltransferase family 4 protein [Cohnella cholangitidis]
MKIPPFSLVKLFGGTIEQWIRGFPQSLEQLSEGLGELCERFNIRIIYLNLPALIPYVLMARSYAGLDLGVLFLAHSVGSEPWVKHWIGIAPWLTERDVLLASTESSKKALLQISDRFELARHIPLCTAMRSHEPLAVGASETRNKRLLSIGRLEDVKNIHLLLSCFNEIRSRVPNASLTIAGEYTGGSASQMNSYRETLERLTNDLRLREAVVFAGPVEGERKDELFRNSDLLINLSTDPGESFGFNLIEAKSWGLPVVCSRWDGFMEVVEHGTEGYLADCDWDEEQPSLRLDQVVEYCVRLLLDESLHTSFSRNASLAAEKYDYKRIMPSIVEMVDVASRKPSMARPNAAQILQTRLSGLPHLYRLDNLRRLPYVGMTILSALTSECAEPLGSWMSSVKPLIHHFAGTLSSPEREPSL